VSRTASENFKNSSVLATKSVSQLIYATIAYLSLECDAITPSFVALDIFFSAEVSPF